MRYNNWSGTSDDARLFVISSANEHVSEFFSIFLPASTAILRLMNALSIMPTNYYNIERGRKDWSNIYVINCPAKQIFLYWTYVPFINTYVYVTKGKSYSHLRFFCRETKCQNIILY